MNEPEKIRTQELIKEVDKQSKIISFTQTKIEGEMIIQDYPNLEEISLPNHELTSLTIINCPNLKAINLRNNQLTKLEIAGENITELIASQNQLETLNLTNCPKISRLIIPDNPLLSKLENLNLANIKDINTINTLVNLAEDYEELKLEKAELLRIIKTLKEGAEEKGLVLTETIQNSIQAEEAIQRLLKKEIEELRYYLDNPEQALPSFQLPETRRRIQEILLAIIQAKISGNYQALITE